MSKSVQSDYHTNQTKTGWFKESDFATYQTFDFTWICSVHVFF